jgi:hypothetical protein
MMQLYLRSVLRLCHFTAGEQEIRVTIGNFGTSPITDATLHWTIDDQLIDSVTWNGNLHFGQIEEDIIIGTYDFQTPVRINVRVSLPDGYDDGITANNVNERLPKTGFIWQLYDWGCRSGFC